MTPVPGEKMRFHFHSTFPAKTAKLEIPHFRTLGNKKRLETVVSSLFSLSRVGGDKRDRTADLLNAIQALSQLSYTPKRVCSTDGTDCILPASQPVVKFFFHLFYFRLNSTPIRRTEPGEVLLLNGASAGTRSAAGHRQSPPWQGSGNCCTMHPAPLRR